MTALKRELPIKCFSFCLCLSATTPKNKLIKIGRVSEADTTITAMLPSVREVAVVSIAV